MQELLNLPKHEILDEAAGKNIQKASLNKRAAEILKELVSNIYQIR